MSPDPQLTPVESLATIIESARRLGVELDQEEALQWLAEWYHETGKCCGLEYAEAFHPMRVW